MIVNFWLNWKALLRRWYSLFLERQIKQCNRLTDSLSEIRRQTSSTSVKSQTGQQADWRHRVQGYQNGASRRSAHN